MAQVPQPFGDGHVIPLYQIESARNYVGRVP
jgi:hypothetical protein